MPSEQVLLKSCVDTPIDEKLLIDVAQKAKDWALMHGAAIRSKTNFSLDSLNFAPFVLTPSSFPRREFNKAVELQTILNELMHWVAHDDEFLRTTLMSTIKVDKFTANLFKIYDYALKQGVVQEKQSLGLLRSDYMAHCLADCDIKQVEINTVASSFAGISTKLLPLQSYVLRELDQEDKLKNLPESNALSGLCKGMIKAWEIIGNSNGVILFVIEDISYNICDQRFHEFEIRSLNPKIKVIRKTLTEIHHQGNLVENNLIVDGHFVSVVYFRAGYEPAHYPTEKEWDARKLIEISSAIKCPSIQYHLAGTKKIQQALAAPGMLKRFLNDSSKIEAVQEIFTGLYSLDDNESGQIAYDMAIKEPERFVLKPQREGGGNNIYGSDIKEALEKMTKEERSSWILMDIINPPVSRGYIIRPEQSTPPQLSDLISELGIFGVIIGDSKNILLNYQAGHMLRTKLSTSNEGGVVEGSGSLDSPYLIDDC